MKPRIMAGHELVRELAHGGLGVVYLGRHPVLHDLRAIKRPRTREGLECETMLARFRREVQIVGSLRHDHIVRAHDAGVDGEGPYLVMEYLEGESLHQLLMRHGRLNYTEVCELVRQAALGLQAAHERGLVHRDVKPSNLVLARANSGARVVVIDWGLAKQVDKVDEPNAPSTERPTSTGMVLGTYGYMAPEQICDAQSVDIRADIYSLGATLYCLLAGNPPFHDRSALKKRAGHEREAFPPLEHLRPDLPADLLRVLRKMVEKDPKKRFASPSAVASALRPFCCDESRLHALLKPGAITVVMPEVDRRPPWPRAWVLAISAVLLLVATTLGMILIRGKLNSDLGTDPVAGVLGDGPASPVSMAGHPGHCSSLVFTPDGLHAISESGGGGVYVWDLRKRCLQESRLHGLERPEKNQQSGGVVAVSPDGSYLATAASLPPFNYMNVLSLYDQNSCQLIKENFALFTGTMGHAIAFSPGRHKLLVTEDLPGLFGLPKPRVRIIEVLTGENWKAFPSKTRVNCFAFSPGEGRYLAIAGNETSLRLRDLEQDRQEREFRGHTTAPDQVAFSGDGQRLFSASSGDGTLRVWNNDSQAGEVVKKELNKIEIGKTVAGKMMCSAFWQGGRALTGHADGSVVLWDLPTGSVLKSFTHPGAQVTAVAVSPDGHHAVAALSDNLVDLYQLPSPATRP
jgi:WD40 repeat protein/tRNA A-37 threonylcarbamoyl transferase component Bud32